eukprot:1161180-Pelagomonas_calceolata.AAC.4
MDPGPDLEEQKKLIVPFMQRAQEIQNADPKVAYYCRLYAVDLMLCHVAYASSNLSRSISTPCLALKFQQRAKEINGLVMAALAALEKVSKMTGA